MVALAVVAIGLAAAIASATRGVRHVVGLEDRTLALWVAQNKAAELRLVGAWPEPGVQSGTVSMASRNWIWRLMISATPVASVRQVRIEIEDAVTPGVVLTGLVEYAVNRER